MKNKFDVAEMITNKFIENMTVTGKLFWACPWRQFGYQNAISGKDYRGINFFLCMLANKGTDFITFNQAKANDGFVRAGSKGIQITFWKPSETKTPDPATGEAKKYLLLRYYTVFALSDIDGAEKLKAKVAERRKGLEFKSIGHCDELVNATEFTITHGKQRAYYSPAIHAIGMPDKAMFKSVEYYYKTLFHEIGHACARELGEDIANGFGSDPYAKEELVAELFANFCLSYCDIDSSELFDNSTAYFQSWLKRFQGDPKLLLSAASKAQKRFDWLLAKAGLVVNETEEMEIAA